MILKSMWQIISILYETIIPDLKVFISMYIMESFRATVYYKKLILNLKKIPH